MSNHLLAAIPLPLNEPVYIILVLLLIVAIAPLIAQKLRIPSLVVLILCGTILGDNVFGVLVRDDRLILLEKCGLLYIMFLAGIQMDLSDRQRLGKQSLFFGILTFAIPFSLGIISGKFLGYSWLTATLLGILYSPHTLLSYPIVAKLGLVQQEAITVAVGGTIVTSILTLSCLSWLQAIANGSIGIFSIIKLLVFLPILILVCLWALPKIGTLILAKTTDSLIAQYIFVLICLFATASATLMLGVDGIVGAFIAGIALNSIVPQTSPLMNRIEFVGNSLLIPAFLISVGTLCNPQLLFFQSANWGMISIVIIGAVSGKFLAAALVGRVFHFARAEVMCMFGLTMSRAALVVVIALFGRNANLLDESIFNAIVVYMILTCLTSPSIVDTFGRQIKKQNCAEKMYVLEI